MERAAAVSSRNSSWVSLCRAEPGAIPALLAEAEANRDDAITQFRRLENLLKQQGGELCGTCHEDVMTRINTGDAHAPAAMGLCLTCHRLKEKDPTDPNSMGNCLGCHPQEE